LLLRHELITAIDVATDKKVHRNSGKEAHSSRSLSGSRE